MADASQAVGSCPICAVESEIQDRPIGIREIQCKRCGTILIASAVAKKLFILISGDPIKIAKVRFTVRRIYEKRNAPVDITELASPNALTIAGIAIDEILADQLPDPHELANNLIIWVGNKVGKNYERAVRIEPENVSGIIGAVGEDSVDFVRNALRKKGYLAVDRPLEEAQLTFDGWERYYQLTKEKVESRLAFMAMSFRDENVEGAFEKCFEPAARQAGFKLQRVDRPDQPSGSITDFIRVDIRRSRFVVADLTGANPGAYWEAGFAEGIGIPVFFTCEEGEFDQGCTHFDLKPFKTIKWNKDQLEKARKELTATIRATLPLEATLGNPDEEGAAGTGNG